MVFQVADVADDEAEAGTDVVVSASPTIAVAATAMRSTRPVAPFMGASFRTAVRRPQRVRSTVTSRHPRVIGRAPPEAARSAVVQVCIAMHKHV
jgi:hypothetical protein